MFSTVFQGGCKNLPLVHSCWRQVRPAHFPVEKWKVKLLNSIQLNIALFMSNFCFELVRYRPIQTAFAKVNLAFPAISHVTSW